MSLFGSSPDDSSLSRSSNKPQSKGLFADNKPATKGSSSLFAEEDDTGDSPWSMPTPKKAARGDLVKNLIPSSAVPDSYIDAFDVILASGEGINGKITAKGVNKLLSNSSISPRESSNLTRLVAPEGLTETGLDRSSFNVLLALIGLVQEGEEPTLDGVDERVHKLPQPSLPYLASLTSDSAAANVSTPSTPAATNTNGSSYSSPQKSKPIHRNSFGDPTLDPWASPALPKSTTQPVQNEETPSNHQTTAARPVVTNSGSRTTSDFTTHMAENDGGSYPPNPTSNISISNTQGAWGSIESSNGFPAPTDNLEGGFGSGGNGSDPTSRPSRTYNARVASRGVEEIVTVTLLPEKEGMFLFQHRNYEVKSARRSSSVVRRYSDFVWLLDCLHKRYPFRQLPLLPPKRVAVNGRHLSSDALFIEKRRRGLVRFSNALVRHPVLSQEQLVVMFLTVPTELSVWRKQAAISVQEEFVGKSLPAGLEDSLPPNLLETFDTVREGVRRSAETYIGLCNLLERLAKRNQGIAADSLRFSQSLRSLTEESASSYATDTNDVPLLNEGIKATAKHLETSHSLLEDEARAWDEGVLEDLKQQRDCLVSMREMFDRRDRYAKDNIPQLERKIESNETKLANLRSKPEGTVKPGELEKVEQAILNDKQSIVNQHARGVFIKECIKDELAFFQSSQYHISKLHQDWSQELVKYSELQADNWRALSEEVENMPTGES